ncbi:conserved hypothetical protein [Ricinus communis]|uniref:Uncharacterized protein n=1 Tax=Ricinus communis TaxID=3988 RepID=B9RWK8_RICCO|nr:conserved hypothetical protein [Ricinus communis]
MKPKALKDKKGGNSKQATNYKAHVATHTTDSFSSNPTALLNDFASYLQEKHGQGIVQNETINQMRDESATSAGLLSKFSSSLIDANFENSQGYLSRPRQQEND